MQCTVQTDRQTDRRTQHTDVQDEHKQGPEQFMGEKEREGLVACGLNACALSNTWTNTDGSRGGGLNYNSEVPY